MAVHTKINKEELLAHLKNYNLGELIDFKGIKAGIDNSNYIVITDQSRYILTIFESRIKSSDLPYYVNLKLHLAQKGICCPKPILTKNGGALIDLKGKKSIIVNFLDGKSLEPDHSGLYSTITKDHCFEIGKTLSQLHIAVKDFDQTRNNDLGVSCFKEFFAKFSNLVEDYQVGLLSDISQIIEMLNQKWQSDLESGTIHSDLFPDNVFFKEDNGKPKVSGVIDFYFAAEDLFIYDLAVMVNAWCFDERTQFDQLKFQALLDGYQVNRKIDSKEFDFLNIALIAAATRFLLSRLHDYFFTPKDSLVKIKNPQEYISKLEYFRSDHFTFQT